MNGRRTVRTDASFTYRKIDVVFLENTRVRLLVLSGKGGDVIEFRDKRTDVNMLWQADHDWRVPGNGEIPVLDPNAAHNFYPRGRQLHLLLAGNTDDFDGTPYSLHAESALILWDSTVRRDGGETVTLRLETDLTAIRPI